MIRFQCFLVPFLLGLFGTPASAADDPKKDDGRTTVVYEIEDLLKRPETWRQAMNKLVGEGKPKDALSALLRVVMSVKPKAWREGGATLQVLNGARLEVGTDKAHHKEIAEILETLRRLTDLSVIAGCELYEVDRDFYKKEIEPRLAKGKVAPGGPFGVVLSLDDDKGLRKHAAPARQNKVLIASGQQATLFSLQTAVLYLARPTAADEDRRYDTVLPGVSFRARTTVSRDRRFVQLRLTQDVTELIELRKRTFVDPLTEKKATAEVPDLVDTSATMTLTVPDGATVLLQVQHQPASVKARGKVLILLLRSEIQILEEEKEKGKG